MTTVLICLAVWLILQIPLGLLVGQFMAVGSRFDAPDEYTLQ